MTVASNSRAENLITFEFRGTVENGFIYDLGIQPGDPYVATVTYDLDTALRISGQGY